MTRPFPCCFCCDSCPDYEDDWTFVFCNIVESYTGAGFFSSGTKLEDFLNGYGAFNLALNSTNVFGSYKQYVYELNAISYTARYFDSAFNQYDFTDLDFVIKVNDFCSPRNVYINVDVYGTGTFNTGTPIYNQLINSLQGTTTPSSTCAGTPSRQARGNSGAVQITGGTFKGTTGVVSLTC